MSTTLVKGQNMPVPTGQLQVTVETSTPADLSALLVTSSGKVRSDADFVFYNQPDGPGVSVRQIPGSTAWKIDLNLPAVPNDIDKVRIVVSLDGTGTRFGQYGPPMARVTDGGGAEIAAYQITGLATESIVVAIEVYRREGAWKARAVGQGYAGGLDELISDHGVVVDQPAAPTAPPAAPPTIPAARPAPVAAAPFAPAPAAPAPAAPPAMQTTGRPGAPVSLVKGQRVSLAKQNGSTLTMVRMGLGWDPLKKKSMFGSREVDIDLDATAIMFADRQPVDLVFYNQLRSKDGSVMHTGDNRTGDGDGDDESVILDLARVPAHVTSIIFIVTSYKGHTFTQVANAFCRLVDETTRTELARYTLSGGSAATGMVMAKLYRDASGWKMHAIGEPIHAKNPMEALPVLNHFVSA
ncbi:transport-associated protein [Catellatospora methionotrophica]|uniref:Transport-associated protein n=1 Tax=Catellatospora methionotrophica TaxID=121620 RepID=A0A8J3LMC0_9ACTN|nr:TerD family protein [Catellatospora methionotrophica]GIG17185.1 transport-associated protein [Catellatospora methionotrophica]